MLNYDFRYRKVEIATGCGPPWRVYFRQGEHDRNCYGLGTWRLFGTADPFWVPIKCPVSVAEVAVFSPTSFETAFWQRVYNDPRGNLDLK